MSSQQGAAASSSASGSAAATAASALKIERRLRTEAEKKAKDAAKKQQVGRVETITHSLVRGRSFGQSSEAQCLELSLIHI
eukprot:15455575-Alexandrium_andersonii.AAC.1